MNQRKWKYVVTIITVLTSISSCSSKVEGQNRALSSKAAYSYIGERVKSVVDKHATEALKNPLIRALSIGIFFEGKPYSFHYGELTDGKNNKPTDDTIYEIASITKTFVGQLAAKAVIEGRLSLDDDIRKYLPNAYDNLEYKGEAIKIKHLLTHTSGIPGGALGFNIDVSEMSELEFNVVFNKYVSNQTKEQFLEELTKVIIEQPPGEKFNYSNPGTNLMGYILERVYEVPFQELLIEKVVGELDMGNTHFHTQKINRHNLASGYLFNAPKSETKLASALWGAEGALKSTIPDLLKYIEAHLANDLLMKETHKKIHEIAKNYWIGYFWWTIFDQNHDLHLRHDGGISRAKSVLVVYPENKIGITIITNQSAIEVNDILNPLTYDIYDDLKTIDKSKI